MDKLPTEVLLKIFQPLHQKDKVECLIVCRAWKLAIANTVLFNTIRLRTKDQLNKLVDMMHANPAKSNKVERLLFEMKNVDNAEIDILSFVFFNVRELVLYADLDKKQDLRFTKILSTHVWSRTIRRIREVSGHLFTDHILRGSMCPVLTKISICGEGQQLEDKFVTSLGNAPTLKTLTLRKYNLSLRILEYLHDKVPLLSSLSIIDSQVDTNTFFTEIKPINSMTTLTLAYVQVADTPAYINFQKYLTKKYPRITNMGYTVLIASNFIEEDCMKLGFSPQIEQIGPTFTSFTCAKINFFDLIFPKLDESNCQLKEFITSAALSESQMDTVVQSKQTQSIQRLSLCGFSDQYAMRYLTRFTVLTKLHISCLVTIGTSSERGSLNINNLLESIGDTVMELELLLAKVTINQLPISTRPNLKTLQFRQCFLPNHLDFFISQSFPNLRTLIIDECIWTVSAFCLANLNLSYLELRDPLPSDSGKVMVETLWNNKKHWYTAHKVSESNPHPTGDPSDFPAVECLPYDQYKGIPCAIFVCNSLYSFFLVNTIK